jgi:pimeloyl-ACP methyl ester carboxylesterase
MAPMTIRKAYVDTRGGQVHFRHIAGGPGVPVVFLHRTPASSASFEGMLAGLGGERPGFAFDTPGFGGSFDPPGQPTILDYRDWLADALNGIGLTRFHLYGHHTGTHIATELAAAWPDRVASLMLNGMAYLTADERAAFRNMVAPALPPDPDGHYLQPLWQLVKSLFPVWNAELVHREFTAALRAQAGRDQAFRAIWDQDFVAVLKRVHCPVLATTAEDDFFLPYLERIRSSHPHARTVVTGRAKVATPELDTERGTAVVREFITDVEAGRVAGPVP